jgi:hypothetical protein
MTSLPFEQPADFEMNHRIFGIILNSPEDKVFQPEQDTNEFFKKIFMNNPG